MHRIALWVVLLTLASPAGAEVDCAAGHEMAIEDLAVFDFSTPPKPADLAAAKQVRDIRIVRQNVFPVDRHWLARQANRFHILTSESALAALLPFETGDSVSSVDLAEAERILRDVSYLYDARVMVRRICRDAIDLDVVVRDVWTLTPRLGFSRSGGDNRIDLGFSDSNFLGWGKEFEIAYVDDSERAGINLFYRDPNIAHSRWTGEVLVVENDDGHRYGMQVQRPFYALDTEWSAGFSAETFDREQGLYFENDKIFELDAATDRADAFFGRLFRRADRHVDRLSAGFRYEREEFEYPIGFPGPLETRRRFAYPYLVWQRVPDQYVTTVNLDRIQRTEDLALGTAARALIGWSPDAIGNDGDHLHADLFVGGNWFVSDDQLLSARLRATGRQDLDDNESEDVVISARATWRWYHHERMSLLARAEYTWTRNLSEDKQLLLGGDTGLRGYPSRYQAGDRRFLVTLEERFYTNYYPFRLFRLGFAAFVDVGRAWFEDEPPAWIPENRDDDHFDVLANVGLGLRIESVRTRRDRVVHIDLARPLVDGPEVGSTELTITVKSAL